MYLLSSTIRDYAWGRLNGVSSLLGTAPSGGPEAEMWIGAHPDTPSIAHARPESADAGTSGVPLNELISEDPNALLGEDVAQAFEGKLPFLTKILSAGGALSLQVHPSKERAKEQFAAENAAGLAPDARHRNYRDDNHKPELIFALTDFAALCGFRPLAESAAIFRYFSTLAPEGTVTAQVARTVTEHLVAADLEGAFRYLISGGEQIAEAARTLALTLEAPQEDEAPGVGNAVVTLLLLAKQYPGDPGVLISALLNRVDLVPGQALYLPAGNVHAYLSGTGVEVMASSDNVLRGGLTPKHIDVPELLANIDFTPLAVPLITPVEDEYGRQVVRPPFQEFQIQVVAARGVEPVSLAQHGPLVFVPIVGEYVLDSPKGDLVVSPGMSVFAGAREAPVNVRLTEASAGLGDRASRTEEADAYDGVAPLAFAVTVPTSPSM